MNLIFEEVIFGVEKEVKYNCEVSCSICNGLGVKLGISLVICGCCYGVGVINVDM